MPMKSPKTEYLVGGKEVAASGFEPLTKGL